MSLWELQFLLTWNESQLTASAFWWANAAHPFASVKVAMVAFFTLLCDRANCSLHSSRVVTHLNCNCPIGIAGKFASCFWSRVEFRPLLTLRVGVREANQEFLHLNMRNHNRNPTSIWTRKIIQQWVNVVNIETVSRSSSSNCSQKPRIEAVKPCRGTRMSSNASSPTHKFSCAQQVLQWNCHLADQT